MAFQRFQDMDHVEQVNIFGLSNIHTFETNVSLSRIFIQIFNHTKIPIPPQCMAFMFCGDSHRSALFGGLDRNVEHSQASV